MQDELVSVRAKIAKLEAQVETLIKGDPERLLLQQQLVLLLTKELRLMPQPGVPPLEMLAATCVRTPSPSLCIQPLSAPLCAPRLWLRPAAGAPCSHHCLHGASGRPLMPSCPPRSHTLAHPLPCMHALLLAPTPASCAPVRKRRMRLRLRFPAVACLTGLLLLPAPVVV